MDWVERIVPVAMERMRDERDRGHLGVGDVLPFGIGPPVEFTSDSQAGGGARRANEVDDHGQTHEGLPAPVGADVGDHPNNEDSIA